MGEAVKTAVLGSSSWSAQKSKILYTNCLKKKKKKGKSINLRFGFRHINILRVTGLTLQINTFRNKMANVAI